MANVARKLGAGEDLLNLRRTTILNPQAVIDLWRMLLRDWIENACETKVFVHAWLRSNVVALSDFPTPRVQEFAP